DSLRRGSTVLDSTVAVLDRLEELSGYMLGVASTDRHLVLGDRALAAFLPELPETTPERPVVEVSLSDDRRRYVLPLSIGGRFSGFLLAKEREAGSGLGTLALQNAATVAAVQLAGIQRSRDVYFRIGTEVLHDLFDAALPEARLKRRVELAGLDTAQPLILLAVEGVPEAKERELYDHLCDRGVLALASREGSLVWVAMPAGDTRLLIEDNALEQAFGISRHIGASRIVADFGGMNKAAREARWALAEAIRRQLLFVDSATAFDQGEQLAWLPRDPFLLDRIVEQTLGPLLASDGGGADLLGTIQTFLEEGQRIDASCRRLGIHRHTLSYRLRRIEALTGRSLHDTDDVVELWRAIRARSALAPVEPGAPEKSENPPARSSHASS
ncbi:MAG: PucR family transcriptional regulator, partial [Acidimicrobiales bacterium]